MRNLRAPQLIVAAAGAVLFVASIVGLLRGDAASDESGGSNAASAVDIIDFTFEPAEFTAAVGETVMWTNRDSATHTVTSEGAGPMDSGDVDEGGMYQVTFDQAGTYDYICTIHPFMHGTVEVTNS